MPYTVEWLIKDHLILLYANGDIPIEGVEAINAEILNLLDEGKPPVHVFADVKDLSRFPFDLVSVRRAMSYFQHPNVGLIMAYGTSRLAASFAQLLTSIAGVRLRFVRDYNEAIRVLAAEDVRIKALLDEGKVPAER